MLFNSLEFIGFYLIVVVLYFLISYKFRWLLLLIASYYFYMAINPGYGLLIFVTTVICYLAAIFMGKLEDKNKRKKYLIIALLVNLGILFIFKYFNFFNENLSVVFSWINIEYQPVSLKLLLPVGISFYTFQSLGYVIDVYRGNMTSEKHFGKFALFVSFFPQLLAGPIGRASKMLPQFSEKYDFDPERVKNGFILIIWGFFKKLVIADRLVVLVDTVYNDPTNYSGWALIIATYFFAVQIYCDFSGYSNIAIGVAKVLGYELPDNFNKPYFAQSIREFWRRWHITLYQWFRDYVYISLGGNRVKKWIMILNILMVFAVTGLWHGAAWTFIIWGMMHGLYMIGGMFWSWIVEKIKLLNRIKGTVVFKFVEILITFHLVVFAWIFFRANSTTDAFYVVSNIFRNLDSWQASGQLLNGVGISTFDLRVSVISILFMIIFHVLQRNYVRISDYISNLKVVSRWSFMYLLIMAVLLFGVFEKEVPFLYFRF